MLDFKEKLKLKADIRFILGSIQAEGDSDCLGSDCFGNACSYIEDHELDIATEEIEKLFEKFLEKK